MRQTVSLTHARKNLLSLSFYGLPLVLYTIFFLIPLGNTLLLSFTSWNGIAKNIQFVGIRNYIELISDKRFFNGLINSIYITAFYMIIVNIVAILAAVLVDEIRFGKRFLKGCFFLPYVLSPIIVGFIWTFMLNYNFGIVNTIIEKIFGEGFKTDWIGSHQLVKPSLIFVFVWQSLGFYFVIYLAGLQGIPKQVIESARIDGAGKGRIFLFIILPMLKNTISICVTLSLINAIKLFDLIFSLTYGGPGFASENLPLYIYNMGFVSNRYGYGSALSIAMLIIVGFLTVVQLGVLNIKGFEP